MRFKMKHSTKQIKKTTLNRFLRKRMIYYVLPNVTFNFTIAYASFHELGYTHFFTGPQSLARLTLPMAIFLPLILTIDIIKRVIIVADQGAIEYSVPDGLKKNNFMMKLGIRYALITGMLTLGCLLLAQLNWSGSYKLNPTAMAILDGLLAGLLSVLFTYLPARKLKKHLYPSVPQEYPHPEHAIHQDNKQENKV